MKPNSLYTGVVAILAVALFVPLFVTHGIGAFDFWWWMGANAAVFIGLSLLDREYRLTLLADLRHGLGWKLGAGLGSAAFLYAVFFVGNILSRELFSFAGQGIENVYQFKEGASLLRVSLLIGLLIGPGEELFWRHFLQRRLSAHWGPWVGFFAASALYALVHLGSGNPMLVLAAGLCGLYWGLLYLLTRSVTLVLISHVVWDLVVFLVAPFSG